MGDRLAATRVKIMATLGPSSSSPEVVGALAAAGASGFRLNGAHVAPKDIPALVGLVRDAETVAGRPLATLFDLAGPKLRVRKGVPPFSIEAGQTVTLGASASSAAIPVDGLDPVRECPPATRVLVHDGKVTLRSRGVRGDLVVADVVTGGAIGGGMGINLPDVETSLPSLTERDLACLEAALAAEIDFVALSFVRRARDIADLRGRMEQLGRVVPIVAKFEKAQAVTDSSIKAILTVSDFVMVARGDLGAETSPERVPVLQKRILRAARGIGVPTITATEMLESMTHEPRPTRAEAADVANAVYDGTDAILLTGETAAGDHPPLVVATAARIIAEAESNREFRTAWSESPAQPEAHDIVADSVAAGASVAADELGAAAVVCFTSTGRTARLVARHRPLTRILALTPGDRVARQLAMVWGVTPRPRSERPLHHEQIVELAEREATSCGLAATHDLIVVTHGAPIGAPPSTNVMRVHRVRRDAPASVLGVPTA